MRLSELQTKEIINVSTGKRLGVIIDVIVDNNGNIKSLILEEKGENVLPIVKNMNLIGNKYQNRG